MFRFAIAVLLIGSASADDSTRPAAAPPEWTTGAPRPEIMPSFGWSPKGGRSGKGAFTIETDARDGLAGFWTRSFPVEGGGYYRFLAYRRVSGAEWPQHAGVATVQWYDGQGKRVLDDRPLVQGVLEGSNWVTPLEHPVDRATDNAGWTEVSAVWQAPSAANHVKVQLHFRWAAKARAEWSDVDFRQTDPPARRVVRLATVHFRPQAGKTPAEKCRQFEPFIEDAARRKADLVVLPETLTYYQTGKAFAEIAEPVPGPSTEYFAGLARKHNVYIVAGLVERDAHLIYNVAVLLTPEGKLGGKYRKVTLPDGEIEAGITPGRDYPTFETRFGRLGMMICYDGFFPEVARELTRRGAEVIAWPVWGCNPDIARARAAENHVYLVSSTYEDISRNWMLSAVWDHSGRTAALAKDWGTVAIAEVDLSQPTRWPSLGDFKSKLSRHTPMVPATRTFDAPPLGH